VVEIAVGDVPVYDAAQRDAVAATEDAAAEEIFGALPDPQGAELLALWRGLVKIHPDGTPRTKHVVTNPILDIDEEAGTAACRSYYTVLQQTDAVPLQVVAAGRYHDEFERVDGVWRFSFRDYSMLDFTGDLRDHLGVLGGGAH
jgi:hypothetical protein